jgi:hypothetical protein
MYCRQNGLPTRRLVNYILLRNLIFFIVCYTKINLNSTLSGGSYGYEDLKAIMADAKHAEHEQMKEWILKQRKGAGPWDPYHFDSTKVVFRDRD